MSRNHSPLLYLFDHIILAYPRITLICLTVAVLFLGFQAKDFQIDASAETLVLENDEDMRYARIIAARYEESDYLFLTYRPEGDLFSHEALNKLKQLRNEVRALPFVSSVASILDVPLLESPPLPIKELATDIRTLESPSVDIKLAKIEFARSPLYQQLLISPDLKTTVLQINLPVDKTYYDLLRQRDHLREKHKAGALSSDEEDRLERVTASFQQYRDASRKRLHHQILTLRGIMNKYRDHADLFLGGVSMIADDLISFIRNDLKVFGLGVLFFLVITLKIIFKHNRWVFLPMLCCACSAVSMIGLLGLFGWEVTVISSNFISLQLIITMAVSIHLIVRYNELLLNHPDQNRRPLILETVRSMVKPCLYAGLTTIAGFGSLLLCDIRPVITFGWMMVGGIIISLIVTFILFPAFLMSVGHGKPEPLKKQSGISLMPALARFSSSQGLLILFVAFLAFGLGIIGMFKLAVENSFIDYFKKTTEIYQGMKVIDTELGGTTPLDVIVQLEKPGRTDRSDSDQQTVRTGDGFDEFDEFDKVQDDKKYWFTMEKTALVKKIHTYLDDLSETGKVLSLDTMIRIGEKLNDDKPLDNFQLALIYQELPDEFKKMVLNPYVSIDHDEVRFSIRVRDSEKTLKRDALLKKIKKDLTDRIGLNEQRFQLTGLFVLYNNMLQSLFRSQILTLGTAVLILMGMFFVLFRSFLIALIAIFPNLLAIFVVLGFMGWTGIPLDLMTITIAAISMGIAVDDTIHYIHRFKREFLIDRNYKKALYRSHTSIGYAMYYTSITIILGFSILVLSNFIPSIYFGILTGIAMLIALSAALTLLPRLLIMIKPFGPEADDGSGSGRGVVYS